MISNPLTVEVSHPHSLSKSTYLVAAYVLDTPFYYIMEIYCIRNMGGARMQEMIQPLKKITVVYECVGA